MHITTIIHSNYFITSHKKYQFVSEVSSLNKGRQYFIDLFYSEVFKITSPVKCLITSHRSLVIDPLDFGNRRNNLFTAQV